MSANSRIASAKQVHIGCGSFCILGAFFWGPGLGPKPEKVSFFRLSHCMGAACRCPDHPGWPSQIGCRSSGHLSGRDRLPALSQSRRLPAPKNAEGPHAAGPRGGGDEGNRTLDLLNAIQALSQLSYTPKRRPLGPPSPPGATNGRRGSAALVSTSQGGMQAHRSR